MQTLVGDSDNFTKVLRSLHSPLTLIGAPRKDAIIKAKLPVR
jgi:hypothetical protein